MQSQLGEQAPYQQLLHTEREIILGCLASDGLKIKVAAKIRESGGELYECTIRTCDLQTKLSQYFEHLGELKQYMKNKENVKIDFHKNMLDVIAKGPTKRANHMLLAQFKLNLVEKQKLQKETPSADAEQWIDNLATEIIGIIESKSKNKDKEDTLRHFIRKSQMDEALDLLRAQLSINIDKNTQEIAKIRQQNLRLENKNTLSQIEVCKFNYSNQMANMVNDEQFLQKLKKEELPTIENKIAEVRASLEQKISCSSAQLAQSIKQESEKLHQNLTRQINIKINQISINFSTKQEIDVIIKKVQSIGNKLETFNSEILKSGERNILHQRLHMQERKLNEIEDKLVKQKSIKEVSPKTSSSQFTPTGGISADSWIDPACSHFGRISLKDNTITMTSYGNARLFGKVLIRDRPIFHVHINAMSNRMSIGVIDTEYKQNVIFGEEPNALTYQSDKRSWNGKKEKFQQGEGFKVDQTVTVSIDLDLGTILWKVGSTLRHSWQSDDLRNSKIKWVPFIKMFDKGDKVSILQ